MTVWATGSSLKYKFSLEQRKVRYAFSSCTTQHRQNAVSARVARNGRFRQQS